MNRYATKPLDAQGNTMGGSKWVNLTVAGLKAFLAIHMYMGMKKQPNIQSYWEQEGSFFQCLTISNIMTRERFRDLVRCLHITNPTTYKHIQKGDPGYDKIRQVRWLMEEIKSACFEGMVTRQVVTIDERMVLYKGTYYPLRQYMPKKPEKWGIKLWMLADSTSKFIYCFDIYYGKNLEAEVRVPGPSMQDGAAYAIVLKLLQGLEEKGHCVVMDNFFSSIPLFRDLASKGIYATGTIRSNHIGIPSHLRNTRTWKRYE
jgi:hypothetical protein